MRVTWDPAGLAGHYDPCPARSGLGACICAEIDAPKEQCDYFWGSHGCDLPLGEHTVHLCGGRTDPCCEYDEEAPEERRVRHSAGPFGGPHEGWGEWGPYGEGWRQ